MPEFIISQDENIINYINKLNLPYSDSIKNHMVNILSSIVLTEGHKTVFGIYDKITCNRHKSTGSRFLNEYSWNNDYVDDNRITYSLNEIIRNVSQDAVGFLVLDDTLSKKDTSTKCMKVLIFIILMLMEINLCGHIVLLLLITK